MTTPDRREIREELVLAWEMLSNAEDDLSREKFRSAVSRAYYATFHAARAVLWTKGLAPKTHKGLLQLFSQHIVQAQLVDREFSVILKDAFDEREVADYHAHSGSFELIEVVRVVTGARRFVTKMDDLLAHQGPEPL